MPAHSHTDTARGAQHDAITHVKKKKDFC
jgi:hypothetical protein